MEALAGFAAELAMAPRAEPGRARKPREAI
jgi:hypothetical protein